jgi:hypothetical protein
VERFVFSLERALKHKERHERLAEMLQLRALSVLRAQETALANLRADWTRAGEKISAAMPALDLTVWLNHYQNIHRLARELSAAEIRTQDAARQVEEATKQRRRWAREAEALRQLRSRQLERHQERAAKAAYRFLEEEGLRRWRMAQSVATQPEEGMP